MTDLWLTLLVKSTAVLIVCCFAAVCLARRSASVRHLVWLSALIITLLLPIGLLLPRHMSTPAPAMFAVGVSAAVLPASAVTSWPAIVWLAIAVAMLMRVVCSYWQALRLVRSSLRVDSDDVIRTMEDCATPAAWGFGRGVILLPVSARAWPADRLNAVLRHERAHLERKDCWSLLIAEIACSIYWFHPLVWYAAYRLRIEQEHAADDSVLRGGAAPDEYASHLLAIAAAGRTHPLLAGGANRSALAGRIEAILDKRRTRSMLNRRTAIACLAMAALLAAPIAAMQSKRKTYKVGQDGVTAPQMVYKQEPAYTQEARDAKIEGPVYLSAVIEDDGAISEVNVDAGLDEGLDQKAVEAVRTWKFKPAEKDGNPVAVSVRIVVNFRLL